VAQIQKDPSKVVIDEDSPYENINSLMKNIARQKKPDFTDRLPRPSSPPSRYEARAMKTKFSRAPLTASYESKEKITLIQRSHKLSNIRGISQTQNIRKKQEIIHAERPSRM